MAVINPLSSIRVNAPPAPGYNRGTRVTASNGHHLDFGDGLGTPLDVTWGEFADGMPWIIADGAKIVGRFPAARDYLGDTIDGFTYNPVLNGTQGYDERREGYSAPPAFPITPKKMDVLFSVESEETSTIGGGNEWRDGYLAANGQAWFTFLTKPPAAGTFSPTIHWPSDDVNRLLRPMRVPDIDGMLARMPNYSASGITSPPAWSSFASTIDQPNAGWLHNAYSGGVPEVDAYGYSGGMPRFFGSTISGTVTNYGERIAEELNRAMMAASLNHWSTAEKRAFLIRMCQHGNQWIEPFDGIGSAVMEPDGGHFQWQQAVSALWLDATGQHARAAALFNACPGNFDQVFIVTASHVANDFVRHTDNTKPYPWRERLISTASGTSLGLANNKPGGNLGDGSNPRFIGLVLNRVSDGDTARILTDGSGSPYACTVDTQASPVWAVSDNVYCTSGFAITAGMPMWTVRGPTQMNLFTPIRDADYLAQVQWAGQIFFMQAMGCVPPIFEKNRDFVELVAGGNWPGTGVDDYYDIRKTTLETQVWNAHWTAASAVSSRF